MRTTRLPPPARQPLHQASAFRTVSCRPGRRQQTDPDVSPSPTEVLAAFQGKPEAPVIGILRDRPLILRVPAIALRVGRGREPATALATNMATSSLFSWHPSWRAACRLLAVDHHLLPSLGAQIGNTTKKEDFHPSLSCDARAAVACFLRAELRPLLNCRHAGSSHDAASHALAAILTLSQQAEAPSISIHTHAVGSA